MLTSPRRIAVVILGGLIGFGLQRWAGIPEALMYGVLLSWLVALFVPARSCPIPR